MSLGGDSAETPTARTLPPPAGSIGFLLGSPLATEGGYQAGQSRGCGEKDGPDVLRDPQLRTVGVRTVVEGAMGAVVAAAIAVDWVVQVVRSLGPDRLVGLLGGETGAGQIAVEQAGGELLAENGAGSASVSYTHLRAHESGRKLVCRL